MIKPIKRYLKITILIICVLAVVVLTGNILQKMDQNRRLNDHMEMAQRYLEEMDYEQAVIELTAALEIEPNNQEIQETLEQVYLDMEQAQLDYHMEMARKYLEERNYEQAIIELTAAWEMEPDNQEIQEALEQAYVEMARIQIEEGRYDEAIENLTVGYDMLQRVKLKRVRETAYREKYAEEEREQAKAEREEEQKEFLAMKYATEEKVFNGNGDTPEIKEYKRKAADFIYAVLEEQFEGYRDGSIVIRAEIKENNDRRCRLGIVIVEGKPPHYYEIEIDKETGKGTIVDERGCDIREDESLFFYDDQVNSYNTIGRTQIILDKQQ